LPFHDYRLPGAYFVTICTFKRDLLFGAIRQNEIVLNEFGHAVEETWRSVAKHFPDWRADSFVVMPNHFHGILLIEREPDVTAGVGARHDAPLRPFAPGRRVLLRGSLGAVVIQFKSAAARHINILRGTPGASVWQRNYYERVLRGDRELLLAREYIRDNPARWAQDPNHRTAP
jgi:REP element-mobilizing transposase RayT